MRSTASLRNTRSMLCTRVGEEGSVELTTKLGNRAVQREGWPALCTQAPCKHCVLEGLGSEGTRPAWANPSLARPSSCRPYLKYFAGLKPSCASLYSMRLLTAVVCVRSRFFCASDLGGGVQGLPKGP